MAEQKEVIEEVEPSPPTKTREVTVDLWKTKLHDEIIGIKQHEQHMAKSRQFTRDMKLFGEVKETKKDEEETIGYLGYREGLWDKEKNIDRRLVIKLFSKSMYYQGTLEEMIGREFTRSISSQNEYPAFNLLIDGHEYMISLNKIRGGMWIFVPEWFVFRLNTPEGLIPVILKHKMGLGIDYRIVNGLGNTQFGFINGRKFNIGGRYDISLSGTDKRLLNNVMARTLILFAASIKFHKDILKKIKKGTKLMKKGEWWPSLSNEELLLKRNPRSILRK